MKKTFYTNAGNGTFKTPSGEVFTEIKKACELFLHYDSSGWHQCEGKSHLVIQHNRNINDRPIYDIKKAKKALLQRVCIMNQHSSLHKEN